MALPYPLRRALLPVSVAAEIVLLALMVPLAVVGVVAAVVDRRRRILRLAAMGACYLSLELAALAAFLAVWLAGPVRGRAWRDRADLTVLAWVIGRVLAAARRTVGFDVRMDERPDPALGAELWANPDPVVVLARHGGIGDSFVLVWLLAGPYRRRPRVVLKELLLWEPLIDVALTRAGACFLPPARRGGSLEGRVRDLAADLAPGDALLIFPEGGNWTPRRRMRAIGRLWADRKHEAVRAAALMDHVLPPRAGGVLACLDERPDLAVVVVAHTGLDKVTSAATLWAALPFASPMHLRWWPSAHPPWGEEERLAWLTTEWAVVDQWIDAQQ